MHPAQSGCKTIRKCVVCRNGLESGDSVPGWAHANLMPRKAFRLTLNLILRLWQHCTFIAVNPLNEASLWFTLHVMLTTRVLFSTGIARFRRDGPGDQSKPRAHALCHRLRFLRQPSDQWHVLCLLQRAFNAADNGGVSPISTMGTCFRSLNIFTGRRPRWRDWLFLERLINWGGLLCSSSFQQCHQ